MAKKSYGPKPRAGKLSQITDATPWYLSRSVRETVESVAIAFILAFLFRTFEAEAFVIPTGSMADTLKGVHKDVMCPECGFQYQASASSEAERAGDGDLVRAGQVVETVCPICRFPLSVDPDDSSEPSYSGDRLLVGKYAYEFFDPERWDVAVFKYPHDAKVNYIKRLVGLPGEVLAIRGGDLHRMPLDGEGEFSILRKPPEKVLATRQDVHNNDYHSKRLHNAGWPFRWSPTEEGEGGWSEEIEIGEGEFDMRQRLFVEDAPKDRDVWVRYRHIVPNENDWGRLRQDPEFTFDRPADIPMPQLIADFYSYNAFQLRGRPYQRVYKANDDRVGTHWVGDLIVECEVNVESDSGQIILDLVEAGVHFECRIDVASGKATLLSRSDLIDSGVPAVSATAETDIRGPGEHELRFANVDSTLYLWVDGDLVEFEGESTYEEGVAYTWPSQANGLPELIRPYSTSEDPGDLAPVGIGTRGATISVEHVRIDRDLYYIAATETNGGFTDMPRVGPSLLNDPTTWQEYLKRRTVEFRLERYPDDRLSDEFLMLGDNSPASSDSRLWTSPAVPRRLLIGKALFIYWPHSWHRIPGTKIPFPFFPNFQNMGLVR